MRSAVLVLPHPAGPWSPMRARACSRVAGAKENVVTGHPRGLEGERAADGTAG
jgi:hypothetical protein